MTQSFDEWFKEEDPFNGNEDNEDCIWAKRFMQLSYESGAQSRQTEVDELKLSATEMSDYIDKAQSCLPYFLKDEKTDSNWIGGVQNKIVDYAAEVDELQKRIDEALELLEYNEYEDSTSQAINILKGEQNEN